MKTPLALLMLLLFTVTAQAQKTIVLDATGVALRVRTC